MKKLILSISLLSILLQIPAQEVKSFKTSDGEILHFRDVGKGNKVIFLAGEPGFGADGMKIWADSLSGDFESILFHQRGTGLSSNVRCGADNVYIRRK